MIQYALIGNGTKNMALVLHNPDDGKVVFKGKPESDLQRSFSLVVDRPVVNVVSEGRAIVRKKTTKTDKAFLKALLDNFVHPPYLVKSIETVQGSHRIDSLADRLEDEYLKEKE